MQDFYKRTRIGLSLLIGFFTGKYLAGAIGHHASEYFSGGFMIGFVLSQYLFSKLFPPPAP